jgi:hypothetical protein
VFHIAQIGIIVESLIKMGIDPIICPISSVVCEEEIPIAEGLETIVNDYHRFVVT